MQTIGRGGCGMRSLPEHPVGSLGENRVGALAWGEGVGERKGGRLGPQGVDPSLPCTVVARFSALNRS